MMMQRRRKAARPQVVPGASACSPLLVVAWLLLRCWPTWVVARW